MQTSPVDEAHFRQVLGHFPTGVTIITAADGDGKPVGFAVGSFASLSLDPPLVLFCAGKSSSTFPAIRDAGRFCVNILAADQEDLCREFASKKGDKFAGIGWRASHHTGSPILQDVLGYIDCEIQDVIEGGDHWIVVGLAQDLEVQHEGKPLIFYRGGYGSFDV